jgi:type II secretory pathway component GspD/PulD (secretin)
MQEEAQALRAGARAKPWGNLMKTMWTRLFPCVAALTVLLALCWTGPVDGQENAEAEDPLAELNEQDIPREISPDDPIDIDFVQKDIHYVIHYIGLRSGLNIQVEGAVGRRLTLIYRNVVPREALRSICTANKLDYVEDGNFITIKDRLQADSLANVVRGEFPGRFNVNFQSHDLVAAINEVAEVTQSDAYVPSAPPEELGPSLQVRGREREDGQVDPDTGRRPLEFDASVVDRVAQRRISMYMREATPEDIMRRLASLGGLDLHDTRREVMRDDGTSVERVGFEFRYRPIFRTGPGGATTIDDDMPLERGEWILPGVDVNNLRGEIRNLLSPRGMVVADRDTHFLVVYDVEKPYMERVREFLDPLATISAARAEQEAAKAFDPMEHRVFNVSRDVNEAGLVTQIQETLSEDGRVIPNADRNTLIVHERRSRMPFIDKLMANLDTAPEQVLISAKLVEVTLDEYIGYGLEMFTTQPARNLADGTFTASSFDSPSGNVGGLFGQPTGFDPFFATFTNRRLDMRLELLANEGRVKTLSQPTTMASNNRPARIEVGQEVPYLESSAQTGAATVASVAFKDVSIVMEVTPTVLQDGLIRLKVKVAVREVIGNIAIEGNNTPVLSKRESQTEVFIHDGETLVMGGLIRERERYDENGLPFLKDIPFLGYLFKSANMSTNKTDLLFFIRPQIVSSDGAAKHHRSGHEVARDLRPLIYEDGDDKQAGLRPGRYSRLEITPRPRHFNPATRPNNPEDVNPGA